MDAETVRRYRDEASEYLERRAQAGRQTPSQQHLKALLDPRDGRIVGLADALLDLLERAEQPATPNPMEEP